MGVLIHLKDYHNDIQTIFLSNPHFAYQLIFLFSADTNRIERGFRLINAFYKILINLYDAYCERAAYEIRRFKKQYAFF